MERINKKKQINYFFSALMVFITLILVTGGFYILSDSNVVSAEDQESCSVTATANPNPIPAGEIGTTISATGFSYTFIDKCAITKINNGGSYDFPLPKKINIGSSGYSTTYMTFTINCTGDTGYGDCRDSIEVAKYPVFDFDLMMCKADLIVHKLSTGDIVKKTNRIVIKTEVPFDDPAVTSFSITQTGWPSNIDHPNSNGTTNSYLDDQGYRIYYYDFDVTIKKNSPVGTFPITATAKGGGVKEAQTISWNLIITEPITCPGDPDCWYCYCSPPTAIGWGCTKNKLGIYETSAQCQSWTSNTSCVNTCYDFRECNLNITSATQYTSQCKEITFGEYLKNPNTYRTKESCQENCKPEEKWSCDDGTCFLDYKNGVFLTEQGCITCCPNPDCPYLTYYKCNKTKGTCEKSSSGSYSSENVCNHNCPKYSCSSTGCTQDNANGTYTTSNCDNKCVKRCVGTSCQYNDNTSNSTCTYSSQCAGTSAKYSCNTSTWTCSQNPNGVYSSLATCNNNCQPPSTTKYSCNTSTWTCYQTSGGEYSSLSACQNSCVRPLCMIAYFELPARAWVGYSITGKWSASDWCDDCDVDCTPYPECVWKQDNIGIGNIGANEYKFKFEQSGTYNYTLTCYGQTSGDQDEQTTAVQVLNLPWWREIIPVLPGFLRGLWR